MKTRFNILLSPDGIALVRSGSEEEALHRFQLDPDQLPDQMEALRAAADEAAANGWESVLVLPDDQVLYTRLTMSDGPDPQSDIRERLDGLTPYDVNDLLFDWEREDEFTVQVAAVAQETLTEAEEFATAFGLNPVGFAATPPETRFPREPWFGPTKHALANPAPEPSAALKHPEDRDLLPVEPVLEEQPEVVEETEALNPDMGSAPETMANALDTTPDTPAKPNSEEADPEAVDEPSVVTEAEEPILPNPHEDVDQPTKGEKPEKDLRSDNSDPSSADSEQLAHSETEETIALPTVSVPEGDTPELPVLAKTAKQDLRQILMACAALLVLSLGFWAYLSYSDRQTAPVELAEVEPVLSEPETIEAAEPASVEEPDLPVPSAQSEIASLSLQPLTTPTATITEAGPGIETPPLRATPALPELETAYALPKILNTTPPIPSAVREEVEEAPAEENTTESAEAEPPAETEAEELTDAGPTVDEDLNDLAAAEAPATTPEVAPAEVTSETATPEQTVEQAPLEAPAPSDIAEDGTATPETDPSIDESSEAAAPEQTAEASGQIEPTAEELAELEGEEPLTSPIEPLVAEPSPVESPVDTADAPAQPEEEFNIVVIEGAPEDAPAIRPIPETVTDDLATYRPATRPETILPRPELRVVIATAETPGYRPAIRPAALSVPRPNVIIASNPPIRPTARARSQSTSIDDAVRAATTPQSTSPVPSSNPGIPTSASIAERATDENELRLRQINLIGVFGSRSDRRALVRLSSGRILRLKVGDRLDGGKVSAITDSALTYVKRGRNVVLKMPNG